MMTTSKIAALALIAFGAILCAWLLFRWALSQRAKARQERARTTKDEIEGWKADAHDQERERSNKEAVKEWIRNFGNSD
jgi:Flp pilus assembly protein TadB